MTIEKSKAEIMGKEFASRNESIKAARNELKKHRKLYDDLAKL